MMKIHHGRFNMLKNEKPIEYKMTSKMFNAMLEHRTEAEKKMNPYTYITNVVNEEFGLKGTVKKILVSDE